MNNFKKWIIFGAISLSLIGAGLCFAIEAAFIKHNSDSNHWIWYGTGALIVFNTGISILGDAIYARMKYDLEKNGK